MLLTKIVIVICCLIICFLIMLIIKNENTFKQQKKIIKAIDKWYDNTGDVVMALNYLHSMEDYRKTLFRLWDWGCKRIVPKNVYHHIKPFIE